MTGRRYPVLAALAVGLLLAACSAPGDHQVGSPAAGIFFEVPAGWTEVPPAQLDRVTGGWMAGEAGTAAAAATIWQTAWSADELVEAADVFANAVPQRLVAYAQARTLYPQERVALQGDPQLLRDVAIGVSAATEGDGLEVRLNELREPQGWLVLSQELAWDTGGTTQTMRLRAMVDPDRARLLLFWLRCSDTCFFDEAKTAERVLDSLVVRRPE